LTAAETVHNGEAEFVAQEEMSRFSGYWWAPDESALAFERFDEAGVTQVRRFRDLAPTAAKWWSSAIPEPAARTSRSSSV
jgi:hypothetical protein